MAAPPEPAFAWELDGDGVAVVGDVDLEFSDSHDLDMEAVAFDGVTGSGSSARPGLIDTTQSFSVATWVSLDHREEYATAVSQIGEVAAAFYLGYAEYQWSFNMKSADGPGGNAHAQAAKPANDRAAWVHLVGVYDDAARQIRLYIDGERVAEAAFSAEWKARGPLTIGRSQADGAPANFWPGAIADVRIYAAALDDADVRTVRDAGRPPRRRQGWRRPRRASTARTAAGAVSARWRPVRIPPRSSRPRSRTPSRRAGPTSRICLATLRSSSKVSQASSASIGTSACRLSVWRKKTRTWV